MGIPPATVGDNIWLPTLTGVTVTDGEVFQRYTTRDELLDNHVFGALEDHDGNMWIPSQGGVVRLHLDRVPPPIFIDAVVTDRRHDGPRARVPSRRRRSPWSSTR